MDYLSTELRKIHASKFFQLSCIALAVFSLIYFAINSITTPDISIFKFIYRAYATLAYFPLLIPPILFTSLLFGREFQDRTMVYAFMRPIRYSRLFISKLAAICVSSIAISVIFFIVTLIYGAIFFKVEAFSFDTSISYSVLRCFILLVYTCIGDLIVASVSVMVNIFSRNLFGSIMGSIIIWGILSIMLCKFKLNGEIIKIPMSTYLNPAMYYEMSFHGFLNRFAVVSIINLILISIVLFIAYKISLGFRKGTRLI